MNKDPKISHIQLRGLMVSAVVGIGVLSMQNSLAGIMGTDGWMAIILTGILIIPVLVVYDRIFKIHPGKDFFEIVKSTLGPILYYFVLAILLVYLVLAMSIVSRILGELIKIILLQATPVKIIIIVFIIATSYIASYEIDSIARMGYLLYPITIVFTLFIVLLSLPKADFTHLLPVFRSDFKSIIKGVADSTFSFFGFEILLFAIPFVEKKENVLKSSVIGAITITLIYLVLFLMALTHFSLEQIKNFNYPILVLVRQLDLPGFFLENLDGVVMALWVMVVFSTMAPLYFASGKVLSKIFNTKKHKYFIWALIPVIYGISIIPDNFILIDEMLKRYYNICAYIAVILIPLLILIVSYVKRAVKK